MYPGLRGPGAPARPIPRETAGLVKKAASRRAWRGGMYAMKSMPGQKRELLSSTSDRAHAFLNLFSTSLAGSSLP